MKVGLEVVKGPDKGRTFEFTKPDTFIVGRGGKNRLVHFKLSDDDPYVSKQHFMLEISPPRVYFNNLGNTNPPHINDIQTLEAELKDGDIIEVGYTLLKVHISDEIQMKTFRCPGCGGSIELMADEGPPEYCRRCEEKSKKEIEKSLQIKRLSIVCQCGKDLTDPANSDGMAEGLCDVVQYFCEGCIKQMMGGKYAGKKIDDYTVIKEIGEGGMGRVLRVYHKDTARVMALKQMLDLKNEEMIKRFDRETRYMKGLNHPNIVRFLESGITKEGPYIVMEIVSKGNLESLIDPIIGFLSHEAAVPYIIEALYGLEFMHRNKMVHRDLKPVNILVQEDNNGRLIPKISDFGLAKNYVNAGGSMLTRMGVGFGTPMYMSPEQIKDTMSVREPADIYSMGVTLYYLLTGKYPYHFPTTREIGRFYDEHKHKGLNQKDAFLLQMQMERIKNPHLIILNDEQIPIQKRNPDIPGRLSRVVEKAIKKEISDRYQSAAEFQHALESA